MVVLLLVALYNSYIIIRCVYFPELQMYKKESHDAINLTFHSSWTLEMVENFMEKMWNTGMFDYYEKWG